jgi:hypothetical protein
MRPSIDYLIARRECRAASGGRDYTPKRNAADDRAQWAGLDPGEQRLLRIIVHLTDLASWLHNRRLLGVDADIPF